MAFISSLRYFALLLIATICVVHAENYPWGPVRGISKDAFIDKIVNKMNVQELAHQLYLFFYSRVSDSNGFPSNYDTQAGTSGIGEIHLWYVGVLLIKLDI